MGAYRSLDGAHAVRVIYEEDLYFYRGHSNDSQEDEM